jgi:hypothetical protein
MAALAVLALAVTALPVSADEHATRFAVFNASLNRGAAGEALADLSGPDDAQAQNVAAIIQRTRPEVLLLNEFDYEPDGALVEAFQANYLAIAQADDLEPISYEYSFVAPSNTGVASGLDLDNDGNAVSDPAAEGYGNDAFGFGLFPGQYGMAVLSQYPIDANSVRTFQEFVWADMPDALLPDDPETDAPADWYSEDELAAVRLSSKSHWDVPIKVDGETVHFLVSHPTPPVFDGLEDRNGTRNHDEIRFWADYVDGADYIYDDAGVAGGLAEGASFVIAGDQNADPFDGDSTNQAILQLLDHPLVNTTVTPASEGGPEQSELQGLANAEHQGDPAFDTADFNPEDPGNLRVDYVLPSTSLDIVAAGVHWPRSDDPAFASVGVFDLETFTYPSSDHKLVWVDVVPAAE